MRAVLRAARAPQQEGRGGLRSAVPKRSSQAAVALSDINSRVQVRGAGPGDLDGARCDVLLLSATFPSPATTYIHL